MWIGALLGIGLGMGAVVGLTSAGYPALSWPAFLATVVVSGVLGRLLRSERRQGRDGRTSNYQPVRLTQVRTDFVTAEVVGLEIEATHAGFADALRTANAALVNAGAVVVRARR